ncbi:MAG: hypothetical protein KC731_25475 [Myxococcales bacterium]|nr:hypothetical protein [Myxococcales bacterium]
MVYEDASGDPPTQDRLDDWILSYGLTTNVLVPRDADDALDAFERRECAYVVETEGMTITWKRVAPAPEAIASRARRRASRSSKWRSPVIEPSNRDATRAVCEG